MARPIKKKLLIHEIEVKAYDVVSGDDSYSDSKVVKLVRVEPTQKTITDLQGNSVGISHILFVDATYSTPFDVDSYVVNTNVVFQGKSLTIIAVEKLYSTKLHHLEVMLA